MVARPAARSGAVSSVPNAWPVIMIRLSPRQPQHAGIALNPGDAPRPRLRPREIKHRARRVHRRHRGPVLRRDADGEIARAAAEVEHAAATFRQPQAEAAVLAPAVVEIIEPGEARIGVERVLSHARTVRAMQASGSPAAAVAS